MKFCPNCGSALTGTDKFCGECGASLVEENIGNDTVEAIDQGGENSSESFPEAYDSSVGQSDSTPPSFEPTEEDSQSRNTTKKTSPSKKAIIAGTLVLLVVVVGCLAVWLLSSGAPSYDKICRMNDDLKQARQLGLSTQEKCAERLGSAILKTTDESLLANLLANISFEERFANAILGKIKSPETIETIARTFKTELLVDGESDRFLEPLYEAVLDRLPDDAAVERIVNARLVEISAEQDGKTGVSGKDAPGKSELAVFLCGRIFTMDDAERAETLLKKLGDSGVIQTLPSNMRLEIALHSKNEDVRQATGVAQDILDLRNLVAKWDPDCLSRSAREIIIRGREIRDAQEYVELVHQFDYDFNDDNLEKWINYGKRLKPVLDAINRLSTESRVDSSDSFRRNRLVEKRDKAKKESDGWRRLIDEIKSKDGLDYAIAVSTACQELGVYMDQSDPYGTGVRLGSKLKSLYQEAKSEMEEAERDLAALDRAASSQTESTSRRRAQLEEQLEKIRRSRDDPPETQEYRERAEQGKKQCFSSVLQLKTVAGNWKHENPGRKLESDDWKSEFIGREKWIKEEPKCPSGGTYTVIVNPNSDTVKVFCSIIGHEFP